MEYEATKGSVRFFADITNRQFYMADDDPAVAAETVEVTWDDGSGELRLLDMNVFDFLNLCFPPGP